MFQSIYSYVARPFSWFPHIKLEVGAQEAIIYSYTQAPYAPPLARPLPVPKKSPDEGRFHVLNFEGTTRLDVGAYPIQDHLFNPSRWGLTEPSDREPEDAPRPVSTAPQAPAPGKNIMSMDYILGPMVPHWQAPPKRRLSDNDGEPGPSSKRRRVGAASRSGLAPEAIDILKPPRKVRSPQYSCLHCGSRPNATKCTIECYRAFRVAHFAPAAPKLQIRQTAAGPHATGLGVFVKPGQTIAEGDWLGEYLGEILPLDAPEANTSDYAFLMPGRAVERVKRVVVDAATHGNWTRFVNSSCDPNVEVVPEQVGKVRIIAFRAARDIHAGEQLLVFYGKDYFEERGLMCCCETDPLPHPPQRR